MRPDDPMSPSEDPLRSALAALATRLLFVRWGAVVYPADLAGPDGVVTEPTRDEWRAALAASPANVSESEPDRRVVWLIERGQPEGRANPEWWGVTDSRTGAYGWVDSAFAADEFATKGEAEAVIAGFNRPGHPFNARAVEHGFLPYLAAASTLRPEDGLREALAALWACGVASGMDTDGDAGPDAMVAGMGVAGFAAAMVEQVQQLRADCDEAGLREAADEAAGWLEDEAAHPRSDPRPAMLRQAARLRAALTEPDAEETR